MTILNFSNVGNDNNTYTYHFRSVFNLRVITARSNHQAIAPLPIDSPERRRLPPLLRRAWYGINQAFRRRIAHLGLTPDQFTVLRTLLECDVRGLSQRELSHIITSDPNTVASLLERMEAAGLVKRKPHEKDRRAHRIQARPRGRRIYAQARAVALDLQAEILGILPEAQREEFLENLSVIANHCRQAADASPKKGT